MPRPNLRVSPRADAWTRQNAAAAPARAAQREQRAAASVNIADVYARAREAAALEANANDTAESALMQARVPPLDISLAGAPSWWWE